MRIPRRGRCDYGCEFGCECGYSVKKNAPKWGAEMLFWHVLDDQPAILLMASIRD